MVIDVEGGELDVLYTIDFSKVQIYIICIELDGQNIIKDNHCRKLLSRTWFYIISKVYVEMNFGLMKNMREKTRLFDKTLKNTILWYRYIEDVIVIAGFIMM